MGKENQDMYIVCIGIKKEKRIHILKQHRQKYMLRISEGNTIIFIQNVYYVDIM